MSAPLATHWRRPDAAAARRIVFVHGFTQTGAAWASAAAALCDEDGFETVAVDAPGHGRSAAVRADLWEGAALLGDTGGRASYVGYSMGARLALHLALARPDLVARLVLVSATAGIADDSERAARVADDERRAREIEESGVAAFLERWISLPLFANLPRDDALLEDRLTNTVDGLASSLRLAGAGSQEPLWRRLGELTMPVLVVAGALDPRFVALGRRIAAGIPGSTFEVVPGAGHTVQLERPAEFLSVLRRWLSTSALG